MWLSPHRVSPFGYPWIDTYLQLPMAFRSLSRPSSALGAKASSLCFLSLDLVDHPSRRIRSPFLSFEIVGSHFLFFVYFVSLISKQVCIPLLFSRSFLYSFCYTDYAVVRVHGCTLRCMVGTSGLEPPTSRLSGVRSNLLSYAPMNTYRFRATLLVYLT